MVPRSWPGEPIWVSVAALPVSTMASTESSASRAYRSSAPERSAGWAARRRRSSIATM